VNQRFRFPISIRNDLNVSVKVGDKIQRGQPLGQISAKSMLEYDVAKKLGVSAKDISKYIIVPVGAEIKAGDVIAKRKTLLSERKIISPYTGKILKVLPEKGMMQIGLSTNIDKPFLSPVSGEVIGITPNLIEISSLGKTYKAIETGKDFGWGALSVLGQWGTVKLDELSVDQTEKIVLIADRVNNAWISKAEALEIGGLICAGFEQGESADPTFPYAFLTSENNQIDRHIWEELVGCKEKTALISPEEKILAIAEA